MINMVILVGNLGRDPEVGETNNNRRYARLSLATSQSWRDKHSGEKREKTEWHRIVVWGDGICNFLADHARKGAKLYVQGKLTHRKFEKDGQDRYVTEIVVQGADGQVRLLGDSHSAGGVPPPSDEPEGRYADSDWQRSYS